MNIPLNSWKTHEAILWVYRPKRTRMEIKTLIGIVVAIVVVGGGIWYVSTNKAEAPIDGMPATTEDTAEGSGTLAELMKRSGSYKCTVEMKPTQANGNTESSGTVYVSAGKMRGDFTTAVAELGGKIVESYMISADGYVYTWSNLMPQGMKMQISATGETTTQGGMDASAAVDYHCAPWSVEASRFTVPTNVTFTAVGGVQ